MSLGLMIMYKSTYYQKQFHKPKMHEYKLSENCPKGHVIKTPIDFICITIKFMINL